MLVINSFLENSELNHLAFNSYDRVELSGTGNADGMNFFVGSGTFTQNFEI